MPPRRSPQPQGIVLAVLAYAERGGVSMGGLFLLALGMYGGQYANLFPANIRDYAAAFCLVVSACGLVAVIYQLIMGWRARRTDDGSLVQVETATKPEP